MAQQFTPAPVPVANLRQIEKFEISPERMIGTIFYSEGYLQEVEIPAFTNEETGDTTSARTVAQYIALNQLERLVTPDELQTIMAKVPEGLTLYEAIKAELYALLSA